MTHTQEMEEFRQEMLDDAYYEQQIENKLYSDTEACAEYYNLQELADKFKEALDKANHYGHNFQVLDFIV